MGRGSGRGEATLNRNREKLVRVGVAETMRAEENRFAIGSPTDSHVRARMVSQAPGFAARGGDHVDVEIAVVIAGVGDHRAVRRKVRTAQQAGAGHQALGVAARAADNPDVSAERRKRSGSCSAWGFASSNGPESAENVRAERKKHGKACQQYATHKFSRVEQ